MRKNLLLAAVCLALPAPAPAADRDKALAVIDQAIKAHGGAGALAKTQVVVRSGRGTMHVGGQEVPFADEFSASLPGRLRLVVEVGPGKPTRTVVVLAGDRGWRSVAGTTQPLSKEKLEELRDEAHAHWAATLVPLRQDGAFRLAPLPDAKVNGRPAAGVRASAKGRGDVKLYFDRGTGLLVKMERNGREDGQPVLKEYVFSAHRDYDGVRLPARRTELVNGQKFADVLISSYRFPGELDGGTFARP